MFERQMTNTLKVGSFEPEGPCLFQQDGRFSFLPDHFVGVYVDTKTDEQFHELQGKV